MADTDLEPSRMTKRRHRELSMAAASSGMSRPDLEARATLESWKVRPRFFSLGMASRSRQRSPPHRVPPRYTSRAWLPRMLSRTAEGDDAGEHEEEEEDDDEGVCLAEEEELLCCRSCTLLLLLLLDIQWERRLKGAKTLRRRRVLDLHPLSNKIKNNRIHTVW